MSRVLLGASFAIGAVGLSIFFWQKQITEYDFSLQKEKQVFSDLKEAAKEFERNAPNFEISSKLKEEIEKLKIQQATDTILEATSTVEF